VVHFLTIFCFILLLGSSSFAVSEYRPSVRQKVILTPEKFGDVTVTKAWARSTTGRNGAVFMTLLSQKGLLVKATSPVCETVELHTHTHQDGILKMREVDQIEISGEAVLQPGGLHIMLIGLKKYLQEGERVPLTLHFKGQKEKEIQIPVYTKEPLWQESEQKV